MTNIQSPKSWLTCCSWKTLQLSLTYWAVSIIITRWHLSMRLVAFSIRTKTRNVSFCQTTKHLTKFWHPESMSHISWNRTSYIQAFNAHNFFQKKIYIYIFRKFAMIFSSKRFILSRPFWVVLNTQSACASKRFSWLFHINVANFHARVFLLKRGNQYSHHFLKQPITSIVKPE